MRQPEALVRVVWAIDGAGCGQLALDGARLPFIVLYVST